MAIKKKQVLIIIGICVVFFATVFVLQRPISIKKEIEAMVYDVNGGEVETTILIDGEISKKLFTEAAKYTGDFQIEWYEPSCREGTDTKIEWYDNQAQSIGFMYNGSSSVLDIKSIAINKTMDNIEIVLLDGTIISTVKKGVPS